MIQAIGTGERTGTVPGQQNPRIAHDIYSRLAQSGYRELREVTCDVAHHVLTLQANVPSYYLKQVAQAAALKHVPHPFTVENRIEVVPRT